MILSRVRRTLKARGQLLGGERVLVACSGGPDSAALLAVLSRLSGELDLSLTAASVDHGLRPDAALEVDVAAALAERFDVPFARLSVEVPAAGASLQAKAREERYGALRAEAARVGAARIAVGHTLDDQAETVLSRLLRGAGTRGLSGISPARADSVIRPLIDCRRSDVHAFASARGLVHRRDPSNDDRRFERVRLRAEVLPALATEDAQVVEHLAHLADEAREITAWIDASAEDALAANRALVADEALVSDELRVFDVALLEALPGPVARAALAGWASELAHVGIKRAHIEALCSLSSGGEVLLPSGWVVTRDGARLVAQHAPGHPSRSHRRGSGGGSGE